jgi:hypothetical protein
MRRRRPLRANKHTHIYVRRAVAAAFLYDAEAEPTLQEMPDFAYFSPLYEIYVHWPQRR